MATPSTTTLLLVRHGETTTTGKVLPGRAPGLHLSTRGTEQAERVAARLAQLPRRPHALYVSPLERTRETARPITRELGVRARVHRGLLECDFGEWTGQSLSALRKRREWSQVQHSPSTFRFPSGESFAEMQSRIWGALVDIAARHRGETVVCVSHADPIKAAVTFAQGTPLDLFQRTVISTCSVSALVLGDSTPLVLAVNSTSTLSELVPS